MIDFYSISKNNELTVSFKEALFEYERRKSIHASKLQEKEETFIIISLAIQKINNCRWNVHVSKNFQQFLYQMMLNFYRKSMRCCPCAVQV